MPIIGMDIMSMEANRENEIGRNLRIDNTPKIKSVNKRKIDALGKDVLEIGFEYECSYKNPEKKKKNVVGSIIFKGNILYLTENIENILKEWKKSKKLSNEILIPVLNGIIRRCLTKAISTAEELKLPPPIRFPIARASDNQ